MTAYSAKHFHVPKYPFYDGLPPHETQIMAPGSTACPSRALFPSARSVPFRPFNLLSAPASLVSSSQLDTSLRLSSLAVLTIVPIRVGPWPYLLVRHYCHELSSSCCHAVPSHGHHLPSGVCYSDEERLMTDIARPHSSFVLCLGLPR